jgi:hypothetical protein
MVKDFEIKSKIDAHFQIYVSLAAGTAMVLNRPSSYDLFIKHKKCNTDSAICN